MKKLFFSTILVLGFSVSGLANNAELVQYKEVESISAADLDCFSYAYAVLRITERFALRPLTWDEQIAILNNAEAECWLLNGNKP